MVSLSLNFNKGSQYQAPDDVLVKSILDKVEYMREASPKKLSILNEIIFYVNAYGPNTAPSQDAIARRAGCGVWWVNQVLQEFNLLGWISSKYRHRHTSRYEINPIFRDSNLRWALKDLLPSLKWKHLYKVMGYVVQATKGLFNHKKDPRPISKDIYINNNTYQNRAKDNHQPWRFRSQNERNGWKIDPENNYKEDLGLTHRNLIIAAEETMSELHAKQMWDDINLNEMLNSDEKTRQLTQLANSCNFLDIKQRLSSRLRMIERANARRDQQLSF